MGKLQWSIFWLFFKSQGDPVLKYLTLVELIWYLLSSGSIKIVFFLNVSIGISTVSCCVNLSCDCEDEIFFFSTLRYSMVTIIIDTTINPDLNNLEIDAILLPGMKGQPGSYQTPFIIRHLYLFNS